MVKGIACCAVIWAFYSLYNLLLAVIKWAFWKANGVACSSTIVALRDNSKSNGKDICYEYTVETNYQGQHVDGIYVKTSEPEKNTICVGETYDFLYNPKNSKFIIRSDLKTNITKNLIQLIVCVAVVAVCFVIYGLAFQRLYN